MTPYSIEPTKGDSMSKDMSFCDSGETYLTNMENNYQILLQKQDSMHCKLLAKNVVHKRAEATCNFF